MSLLSKGSPPLLMLIDEFAVMIGEIAEQDREEAKILLRWFRAARNAPDTQTRFVIGGSVNLIYTLDSTGLIDTVNDFYIERLKPFDCETAGRFIETIFASRNIKLGTEVKDAILELVGEPIPYLIAVLLSAVIDRRRTMNVDVTREMVKVAFEDDLLGGAASVVLQQYRSRIDQYYHGQEHKAAKTILGIMSKSESPVKQETLYQIYLKSCNLPPGQQVHDDFSRLMHKLDNDFYVVSSDRTYMFFSRVLKLWWKAHYGFQEY